MSFARPFAVARQEKQFKAEAFGNQGVKAYRAFARLASPPPDKGVPPPTKKTRFHFTGAGTHIAALR